MLESSKELPKPPEPSKVKPVPTLLLRSVVFRMTNVLPCVKLKSCRARRGAGRVVDPAEFHRASSATPKCKTDAAVRLRAPNSSLTPPARWIVPPKGAASRCC